jgi:hypothetical protein
VNSCAPEGLVAPGLHVTPVLLLLNEANMYTHFYNRYTMLMHVGDVRLIWMHVDIKIFLPLVGQFSEIIVYSFVCAVWSRQGYEELIQLASKTIIYYDKMFVQIYIYNMNKLCPPFNEGRGIVIVGFLLLLLVILPMLITTLSIILTRWHNLQLIEGSPVRLW